VISLSTTYVDGTTPLDAAHMNALQQKVEKGAVSGYPGLDASGFVVVPATGGLYIGGDTQLIRASAGILRATGSFQVGATGQFQVSGGLVQTTGAYYVANSGGAAQSVFGDLSLWTPGNVHAGGVLFSDVFLYKSAAGVISTGPGTVLAAVGGFNAQGMGAATYSAFLTGVAGDTQARFYIGADGKLNWGPGNAAVDTNLFRQAAGTLATAGAFVVNNGLAGQFYVNPSGTLVFGSAQDATFYRLGAATLGTDGDLVVRNSNANQIALGYAATGATIGFGPSRDAVLYRYAANFLATNGNFWVGWGTGAGSSGLGVVASGDGWPRVGLNNNSYIIFGPGNAGTDTNLYRYGAAQLATDGMFFAHPSAVGNNALGVLVAAEGQFRWRVSGDGKTYWGDGTNLDTNLYRAAANLLKTDGNFVAGSNLSANGGILYLAGNNDTYLNRISAGVVGVNGVPLASIQKGHNVFSIAQGTRSIQTITFPTAFATPPTVLVAAGSDSDYGGDTNGRVPTVTAVVVGTPTTTTFQVQIQNNTNSGSVNVHVWWMAQ